jgi:2,3-bisphosphoglycerate-dependent phosphoglycerate mutase
MVYLEPMKRRSDMELLVIRHGQSEADLLKCHEGRADFPLTALGIKQAELLADWIRRNYPPDFIISSPLKRARKTAEIIASLLKLNVQYDDDLMEYNNGKLAGLPYEEAAIKYPEPPENKKAYISFYGQETLTDFRARAEKVLMKIIDEYPTERRVAIVSHGNMINMLFRSFLKMPINLDCSISSGDTAVHYWKVANEKRKIIFLNRMEHLLGMREEK